MSIVKKTPMAISGLALALASLGNLLLVYGQWIRYLCGSLSAAILILFMLKFIFDFKKVKEELHNPVVLSALPTSTMALMLLCTYAYPFISLGAILLWHVAVVAQLFIMFLFVKRFVIGFSLKTVFPSWFVVSVGIIVASVTGPVMNARLIGQIAFIIGFSLYFVILPVVICRMVKIKPIPEPARPTIAILTAPMSLSIVGYISAFERPNQLMIYLMLVVCVICYIYVTVNMVSLLKLKFYPTYAAFTFPYVISATAFKLTNEILVKNGHAFFSFMPKIGEYAAIVVVVYVVLRYVVFMTKK